jgi:hypothetical protein
LAAFVQTCPENIYETFRGIMQIKKVLHLSKKKTRDMENNMVFHDFKNRLRNQKQLANGDWKITGKVIYKWQGKSLEETMSVYIRLVSTTAGSIDLDEGEVINSDQKIHMKFSSLYENPIFSLDDVGILKIKGKSSPYFGSCNYEVTIIPF